MSKRLLFAGGVLNSVFCVFHIVLGIQISRLSQVAPPFRALMEALDVGGVLFIFFFAYASFVHGRELLETALGQTMLVLVAALYLSRAAEEFFLFKFNPGIFGSCIVVGGIYVALFVIAMLEKSTPQLVKDKPPGLRRVA